MEKIGQKLRKLNTKYNYVVENELADEILGKRK